MNHVRDLAHESARWHLAGRLLRRPRSGWRAELQALAREAADPALAAAASLAHDEAEGPYLALLGPGGALSPREVSYKPLQDPGRILAEIAGFHEAFSYPAGTEDPRDHVAVAADFVGFLALKEAYATAAGRPDDAETTREARERFVERHVRVMARGMSRRAEQIEPLIEHLSAALHALRELSGCDASDEGTDTFADETAFLRPGLDSPGIGCDGFDDECPGACAGPDERSTP